MKCHLCGSENRDTARFCQNCGASTVPPKLRCTACDAENDSSAKFCLACGNSLPAEPLIGSGSAAIRSLKSDPPPVRTTHPKKSRLINWQRIVAVGLWFVALLASGWLFDHFPTSSQIDLCTLRIGSAEACKNYMSDDDKYLIALIGLCFIGGIQFWREGSTT
jgi:hypothetical protein